MTPGQLDECDAERLALEIRSSFMGDIRTALGLGGGQSVIEAILTLKAHSESLGAEVAHLSKPGHDGLCNACGR
jgi:hypothetical protein